MRIVFMGTPDFSLPALDALAKAHEVLAVYCQPPRPAGRGQKARPSPVQARAEALGIPVRHPKSLRGPDEQAAFAALGADLAVVVAYGLILPKAVLEAPAQGCLNIHASLLPRWRGAAPIHRAVLAGDAETGVCIMRMEEGLDTGPVLLREAVAIGAEETTGDLHDRLAQLGAGLILKALGQLEATAVPQPDAGVSYAAKIGKAEARIDWTRPAVEVDRLIRGLSPVPGAWCLAGEDRLKLLRSRVVAGSGAPGEVLPEGHGTDAVPASAEGNGAGQDRAEPGPVVAGAGPGRLRIACGTGGVEILLAQREGRRPMEAGELLRGFSLPERLD